jgi:hypothetical protein
VHIEKPASPNEKKNIANIRRVNNNSMCEMTSKTPLDSHLLNSDEKPSRAVSVTRQSSILKNLIALNDHPQVRHGDAIYDFIMQTVSLII